MDYLKAMCYVWLGDFSTAATIMYGICYAAEIYQPQAETTVFYKAVYHYLVGMCTIKVHSKVIILLNSFFDVVASIPTR